MLRDFLETMAIHPWLYWAGAGPVTAIYLLRVFRPAWRAAAGGEAIGSVAGEAAWIGLLLLAWRWPWLLVPVEFNPDESQLIAGALTLRVDPVFWRSVDGTTSGPLNFYALLPLTWLGLPADYFSARLTGLILVWASLLAGGWALRQLGAGILAPVAVAPAALFFAATTDGDFVHYSSEHVVLALVPFALGAGARYAAGGDRRWLWAGGLAAGAVPWAKLQGAPLAAVALLWLAVRAWRREAGARRRGVLGGLAAAATGPALAFGALTLATGEFGTLLHRYVLQNLHYVEEAATFGPAIGRLAERALRLGQFPVWALPVTALALGALIVAGRRGHRPAVPAGLAAALLGAAAVAVAVPRRDFLHYLLLFAPALVLLAGAGLATIWPATAGAARRRWLVAALVLFAAIPLGQRARWGPPEVLGRLPGERAQAAHGDGLVLRRLAQEGDRLAIWGWSARTYVEAGLAQATRDAHSYWATVDSPVRPAQRDVYLRDFRRHRPAFFLDATGPGAFFFGRREEAGHETFPALAEEIRRGYVLLIDLGYARLYARGDRVVAERMTAAEVATVAEAGRPVEAAEPAPAPRLSGGGVPTTLGTRTAQLLAAPAAAEWPSDGTLRALKFSYGFAERALREGESNGAELLVELDWHGERRVVWREFLNPHHRPEDRPARTVRLPLPLHEPGTVVRIRSLPGPGGDNAWDWVVVRDLWFEWRAQPTVEQLPGFTRLPVTARAPLSHLRPGHPHGTLLHAPAELAFTLTGHERRLRLSGGLEAGAFSEGGHTDGVVFTVAWRGADGALRELHRRMLDPRARPADRDGLHLELDLPEVQPGDLLLVRIETGPAGNPAWDWAYLRALVIE